MVVMVLPCEQCVPSGVMMEPCMAVSVVLGSSMLAVRC